MRSDVNVGKYISVLITSVLLQNFHGFQQTDIRTFMMKVNLSLYTPKRHMGDWRYGSTHT